MYVGTLIFNTIHNTIYLCRPRLLELLFGNVILILIVLNVVPRDIELITFKCFEIAILIKCARE